jgi:hypothetical protein
MLTRCHVHPCSPFSGMSEMPAPSQHLHARSKHFISLSMWSPQLPNLHLVPLCDSPNPTPAKGQSALTEQEECRILRDNTAFKLVELDQIARAYRNQSFKSPKLNMRISTNVMALPTSELNLNSCCQILHNLAVMHWRDTEIYDHLVCLESSCTTICFQKCFLPG